MENIWKSRQLLKNTIREFFTSLGYVEIDTPILVRCPGAEVHLDFFESRWTQANLESTQFFLRSSPELHMKRALKAAGNKVFQLAPSFRNVGEFSDWHHPEFTMLEWYEAGINFEDFMSQSENLIQFCYDKFGLHNPRTIPSIQRLSVYEAFKNYAQIDLIDQDTKLGSKGCAHGFHSLKNADDFETAFFKIMLDIIEPKLQEMEAVFLYDYPPSMAALAKVEQGRAKRFELYLNGHEICNAFWELIDPAENRARLEKINQLREKNQKQKVPLDEKFLSEIEHSLEDCCGNALGFDRLLALLLKKSSLDDVIPFRNDFRI